MPGAASSASGSLMSARTTVVEASPVAARAVDVGAGIVVHVHHAHRGVDRLRDLVSVLRRRQAGAEVEELGDALARHEPHRASQRRAVEPRPLPPSPIALTASAATARSAAKLSLPPRMASYTRATLGLVVSISGGTYAGSTLVHAMSPRATPNPPSPES